MRRVWPVVVSLLLTGCGAETGTYVIDARDGTSARVTSASGEIAWTPDGRVLVADGGSLRTFAPDGEQIAARDLRSPEIGSGIAVARDGRLAAVVAPEDPAFVNGGDLVVDGKRVLEHAYGPPLWSPDGRRLAVMQMSDAEARGDIGGPGGQRTLILAADGRELDAVSGVVLQLLADGTRLSLHDRMLLAGERQLTGDAQAAAAGPDGTVAVITSNATLTLVSGDGEQQPTDVRGNEVTWSPDGRRLAVSDGERILLLDAGDVVARELVSFAPRSLNRMVWSPDGRRLLATVDDPPAPD